MKMTFAGFAAYQARTKFRTPCIGRKSTCPTRTLSTPNASVRSAKGRVLYAKGKNEKTFSIISCGEVLTQKQTAQFFFNTEVKYV